MGWRQVCTSGGDTLRRTWCLPPSRGERWLANTWGTPQSQLPALCRQATSYAWSTPTTEIQPPGPACGVARAVGLQSASSPKPTRVHAEMPSFHNAQKREPADHQGNPPRLAVPTVEGELTMAETQQSKSPAGRFSPHAQGACLYLRARAAIAFGYSAQAASYKNSLTAVGAYVAN